MLLIDEKTGAVIFKGETRAECNRWRLKHYHRWRMQNAIWVKLNRAEMPHPLLIIDETKPVRPLISDAELDAHMDEGCGDGKGL